MADPRRDRGTAGEDAAAEFLTARGYELVARNYRTRYGELDIVAVDGDCLVFCEVRARVGRPAIGIRRALESIGPAKQLQVRKMANEWQRLARPAGVQARRKRFDVVVLSIAVTGRVLAMKHLRGAF